MDLTNAFRLLCSLLQRRPAPEKRLRQFLPWGGGNGWADPFDPSFLVISVKAVPGSGAPAVGGGAGGTRRSHPWG